MFYKSKIIKQNGETHVHILYDIVVASRNEKMLVPDMETASRVLEQDRYIVLQVFFEKVVMNFKLLQKHMPGYFLDSKRNESLAALQEILIRYPIFGRTSKDLVNDIRDAEYHLMNVLPPKDHVTYNHLLKLNKSLIFHCKMNG